MAGPSVYIHSEDTNANLSVNIGLIDNIKGTNSDKNNYVEATIAKLLQVQKALNYEADKFLEGLDIGSAQDMADNTNELLRQLATEALYGENSSELVRAITQEQTISRKSIESLNVKGTKKIRDFILDNIKDEISVSELARLLTQEFAKGETVIEVSEANAAIVKLGKLFDVKSFDTAARKTTVEMNKKIFRNTKTLVTNRSGAFRTIIRDLLRSSRFTDKKKREEVINRFCESLKKEMKEKAKDKIKFIYGEDKNKLNAEIDRFIKDLNTNLKKSLSGVSDDYLSSYSAAGGAIGEQIRDSVTQTADSTIITFTIGDEKESEAVKKVNDILKNRMAQTIGEMQNFRGDVQSLTDVVLLNVNTGRTARAQSKNHFVDYFTKESNQLNGEREVIENFRWTIENNVQLLSFISDLSKEDLGMGLNDFDINNIMEAMANNLWFKYHKSATAASGGIVFSDPSVDDFQKELEGSLEKLLTGQITNFLGVTVLKNNNSLVTVSSDSSNLFYLLNGRMKKTADLIGQAIDQLRMSENLKLNNSDRMVIVNLDGKGVQNISPGKGSESFLPYKLQTLFFNGEEWETTSDTTRIGEEMGEDVLKNIKIKVSLGTSIKAIQSTSFNGLV